MYLVQFGLAGFHGIRPGNPDRGRSQHNDRPRGWSSVHIRQIELVQTFADQAVIAIENARLFNETQEALERLTATSAILKVIASSPWDVQPVFAAIAESAAGVVGGHSALVTRIVGDHLHPAAFAAESETVRELLARAYPRDFPSAFVVIYFCQGRTYRPGRPLRRSRNVAGLSKGTPRTVRNSPNCLNRSLGAQDRQRLEVRPLMAKTLTFDTRFAVAGI